MTSPKKDWVEAWHVNPSANKDYDLIDGLRGIAILAVVCGHLVYINQYEVRSVVLWLFALAGMGGKGVNIFFTLSGFLISWPFWKRKAKGAAQVVPPGYGWRRFYKIYPPLALSILLLTPMYVIFGTNASIWLTALQWLSGLSLFIPPRSTLNPVMWSLIVEVQFYLLLPLIFLCLQRVSMKTCLWVIFLFLLLGGQLSQGIYALNNMGNMIHPYIKCLFPSFLDAFAFGVLLAGLESYWNGLPKAWGRLGDIGMALLVITFLTGAWLNHEHIQLGDGHLQSSLLILAVNISTALALCYIARPQQLVARQLCFPWLRWCGIISYEWYLFHQPIFFWTKNLLHPAQGQWLHFLIIEAASFLIGLAVAATIYRFFSLPILKRGRGNHAGGA